MATVYDINEYNNIKKATNEINDQIRIVEWQIASLATRSQEFRNAAGTALSAQLHAQQNALGILSLIAEVQHTTDLKLAEERRQAKNLSDETVTMAGEMVRQTEERVDAHIAALKRLLDEVRDPTSGELRPLEEIYEALFELHRDDALRADEYDELEYLAAGYDEEMLEAHPYDVYGKLLLAVWNGIVSEITAAEYDALQLSAEAFGAYDLSAAKHDLSAKSLLR